MFQLSYHASLNGLTNKLQVFYTVCKITTYKGRENDKQMHITAAEVLPMSLLSAASHSEPFSTCCSKVPALIPKCEKLQRQQSKIMKL